MLKKISRKRVAIISGWAVDPNAIYRYQVNAAFALSDHADYNDLVRYVELITASCVYANASLRRLHEICVAAASKHGR